VYKAVGAGGVPPKVKAVLLAVMVNGSWFTVKGTMACDVFPTLSVALMVRVPLSAVVVGIVPPHITTSPELGLQKGLLGTKFAGVALTLQVWTPEPIPSLQVNDTVIVDPPTVEL
jgi:hypothetical protein